MGAFEDKLDQWAIEKLKTNPYLEIKTDENHMPLNPETEEIYEMIIKEGMSLAGALATYGRARGAITKAKVELGNPVSWFKKKESCEK